MVEQVYRPRRPKASPLWQCLYDHFDAFLDAYTDRYQSRHGFLRPIIPEVVNKFLDCGDQSGCRLETGDRRKPIGEYPSRRRLNTPPACSLGSPAFFPVPHRPRVPDRISAHRAQPARRL